MTLNSLGMMLYSLFYWLLACFLKVVRCQLLFRVLINDKSWQISVIEYFFGTCSRLLDVNYFHKCSIFDMALISNSAIYINKHKKLIMVTLQDPLWIHKCYCPWHTMYVIIYDNSSQKFFLLQQQMFWLDDVLELWR